jgi:hypothetical protein
LETKNIVHNLVEEKTKIFRKSLQWTKQKIEWNNIKWEYFIYEQFWKKKLFPYMKKFHYNELNKKLNQNRIINKF